MHRAPPDARFTSADMRLLLKNLRGTTFKSELSKRIEKCVGHLIDHGLLEAGEAKMKQDDLKDLKLTARAAKRSGEAPCSGKAGRLMRKRSAQEVQDDPKASAEQKRLRLSMNDFPA